MKKVLTKMMVTFILLLSATISVNAQSAVYSGEYPIVMTGYEALVTNPKAANWGTTSSTTPSNTARTGKCFGDQAEANMNAGRFLSYRVPGTATISVSADGTSGRGLIITAKDALGNDLTVAGVDVIDGVAANHLVVGAGVGNDGNCTERTFTIDTPDEVVIRIYSPTQAEVGDGLGGITGYGSTYISNVTITKFVPSTPTIDLFKIGEVEAVIDQDTKTITKELPFGTNLTAIEPVVTIGGTATSYSPTGVQDFSSSVTAPVVYTATDGTLSTNYSVTITAAATASAEKDIIGLTIGAKAPVYNAESKAYSLVVPKTASLSLPVTFDLSMLATADFTSGTVHDFTTPLTITVTAQDATTQAYTLTVTNGIADIAYVVNTGLSVNDTKVYPMLLSKGYYVKPILASGNDLTQFNDFDLVVLNEEPSSSNSLALAMVGLIGNKPFLNLKSYMYGKTGWPTGGGNNGTSDTAMVITKSYLSHPIFEGVALRGDSVDLLPAGIVGNGLQGVNNPGSGKVMTHLVSNPAMAGIIEDNTVATAKYMLIPISNVNYGNLTENALTLIDNAIEYLMSDAKFAVVAPQIALTQGPASQAVKVGTAIQDVVFSLTNADGATVEGLPTGVEGAFAEGVMTISGTVPDSLAAEVYEYTVTATGWPGYDGEAVTATGKISLKPVDALDVYYMIGGATVPATDLVYPYLSEKPNMLVTVHPAASTAPEATIYDAYDLVVVHESVSGNNAQLVALKSVDKAILNFKAYSYTNGRWSWGAPNNGLSTNLAVTVQQPSHPIFDGVDAVAAGTALEIISAVANSKGIQPADVNNLPGSINVATAPKGDGNPAVAIHDVPAAVRGVTSKYIMIPLFQDTYQHLNATAFKLIDNALAYLFSETQFAVPDLTIATFKAGDYDGVIDEENGTITVLVRDFATNLAALEPVITLNGVSTTVSPAGPQDFTNSMAVPVVYTVGDMINKKAYNVTISVDPTAVNSTNMTSYFFDGQVIQNPERETLKLYDISGRMILESNENISMKSFSQGVYIIRAETSLLKITL